MERRILLSVGGVGNLLRIAVTGILVPVEKSLAPGRPYHWIIRSPCYPPISARLRSPSIFFKAVTNQIVKPNTSTRFISDASIELPVAPTRKSRQLGSRNLSLFGESQRRSVLRVGAAYIVTSWLLIQWAETICPLFGFGDAPARMVVIVLAIGLVPAYWSSQASSRS